MTMNEYKARMLCCSLEAGKALCDMTVDADIKTEPEQVRKNVATILALLTETEDFINDLLQTMSDSGTIITDTE